MAELVGSNKEFDEREQYERSGGSVYDKGRSIEAIIARHPRPETVRYALRSLQLKEETFNTNGEPDNRWEMSHRASTLHDRAIALGIPVEDLERMELVDRRLSQNELQAIREQRGKTIPMTMNENFFAKPKHVDGFGLESFEVPIPVLTEYESDTGNSGKKRYRLIPQNFVYLGTEAEKSEASKEFFDMRDELTARHLMMQMWGHHVTYYYALQKLAEGAYFGTILSSEGLGVLFNLKGQREAIKETVTGVELRSLGDKVETAMRLYYVAALCEKPDRFRKELIDSPGWKQFLFPDGTDPDLIKQWIGSPGDWELEVQAGGERTKGKTPEENTLNIERKAGLRGRLTQKNIFAASDTFVEGNLNKAIEEFVGGGENVSHVDRVEAETARRIAFRMFRLFLLADQEGLELYKKDSKGDSMDPFDGLDIEFENAPAASDFGKLTHPDAYAGKSKRKGRDYMPPVGFLHAREYYSRFMVDFFRHASAFTEVSVDGGLSGKGYIAEERSLMERWWGYKGGFVKNNVTYLEEKAVRLGDLPWATFNEPIHMTPEKASMMALPVGGYHSEAFKTLWLSGFMAGGTDRAHPLISETNLDSRNLKDLGWWRKFWKMLDVGIKKSVALNGIFRGVSDTEKDNIVKMHKIKIVQNFIMGLQSLPQWEEWEREDLKVKTYRENKEAKEPGLVTRIFEVANEALKESGVELKKPSYYKELLKR